jgi:hypothetical protein
VDPISIIVILLAAYGIATRIPAFARAQAAARQKAADWASAGGGWLGGQRDRARGAVGGALGGAKDRARGAVGGVVGRIGAAIRDAVPGRDRGDTTARFVDPPFAGGADGGPEPIGPGGSAGETTGPSPEPDPGVGTPEDSWGYNPNPKADPTANPEPGPDPTAEPVTHIDPPTGDQRPPIYVGDITPPRTTLPPSPTAPTSTTIPAGTPAVTGTATALLEGPKPMSDLATRGGEVTGVVSGAAEALASAKGAANNVTGEVSPALLQVARQFDARNS